MVGYSIWGLNIIEKQKEIILTKGPRRVTPFLIPMIIKNMEYSEPTIEFGLKGINFSIDTACSNGTHAIHKELTILISGDAKVMPADGIESIITPLCFEGFVL